MAKTKFTFFSDEVEEMWSEYGRLVKKWRIPQPKPPKISSETGCWVFYLERPDRKAKTKKQQRTGTIQKNP